MADDLPADAQDELARLLATCGTALDEDDYATAREAIDSAETVVVGDLPESDLRAHLLHGCSRVAALLDPEEEVEAEAAAEYVAAMQRRLPDGE